MKIHEYQAKEILRTFGVATPRGQVTDSPKEAGRIANEFGGRAVVKAQIHAGGRGKGGGVKLAKSPDEAVDLAKKILGMQLVTHQTGPQGQKVKKILVEEALDIAKELYLGITLDRGIDRPVMMVSKQGGMEIEAVAAKDPAAIVKEPFDPAWGLQPYQARKLADALSLKGDTHKKSVGFLIALDAKMNFDDNALFRHPNIKEYRDLDEEDALEVEASKYGLNYIKLDGNVGCMVNGAGLAMATMDIIQYAGGKPANFLDVGGGANEEQVKNAMRIILSDANVKAVLINIFGGIMRCDIIATGVVNAIQEIGIKIPVVVRLEGTNVEEGKAILVSSGLKVIAANDMKDAAEKVIASLGKGA